MRLLLPLALSLALLFPAALAHADPTARIEGGQIRLSAPLLFETHAGTLDPGDGPLLDAVAALMRAHPTLRIEIGAHTDARGSDASNQAVTEGVARQVRMALIGRGIAAERLTAVGYGETRPIADNLTADGRAANRRIELVVVQS